MTVSSVKVDVWNRAMLRIGETKLIQSEDEPTLAAQICRLHHDDTIRQMLERRTWRWAIKQTALTIIDSQFSVDVGDTTTTTFAIQYPYLSPDQVTVTNAGFEQTAGTEYTFNDPGEGQQKQIVFVTPPAGGAQIVITVTATRYSWDHLFQLPADFVRPVGLLFGQNTIHGARFDLQANKQRIPFKIFSDDAGTGRVLACDLTAEDFDQLEYVAALTHIPLMPREFVDALVWYIAAELAESLPKDAQKAEMCRQRAAQAVSEAFATDMNTGHDLDSQTPSISARGGSYYGGRLGGPWGEGP